MTAISKAKVEALAKASHAKCHGRGVLGYRPGTHAAVLCTCVVRNLRRHGVNTDRQEDVAKFLEPEPTGETP